MYWFLMVFQGPLKNRKFGVFEVYWSLMVLWGTLKIRKFVVFVSWRGHLTQKIGRLKMHVFLGVEKKMLKVLGLEDLEMVENEGMPSQNGSMARVQNLIL